MSEQDARQLIKNEIRKKQFRQAAILPQNLKRFLR